MNHSSIIIPCKNEGIYLKQTLDFMLQTEAKNISDIIVVDDHSNDRCCEFLREGSCHYQNVHLVQTEGIGAAQARNLGASLAAEAETLVFCDAHIIMEQGWLNNILEAFDDKEVSVVCPGIGHFEPDSAAGYGQTWNDKFEVCWLKKPQDLAEIPLAPGGCMAIRKNIFDAVGGFDRDFRSWGYEDVELSLKLWLFGFKIFVQPKVKIGHKFRKVQPYSVNLTEFNYNKLRMALSHFSYKRYCKLVKSMGCYPNFDRILERLINSDTYRQRQDYFNCRIYDDDWFFNKFKINF